MEAFNGNVAVCKMIDSYTMMLYCCAQHWVACSVSAAEWKTRCSSSMCLECVTATVRRFNGPINHKDFFSAIILDHLDMRRLSLKSEIRGSSWLKIHKSVRKRLFPAKEGGWAGSSEENDFRSRPITWRSRDTQLNEFVSEADDLLSVRKKTSSIWEMKSAGVASITPSGGCTPRTLPSGVLDRLEKFLSYKPSMKIIDIKRLDF